MMLELLLLAFWESVSQSEPLPITQTESSWETLVDMDLVPLPHKDPLKVAPKLLDQAGVAVLAQDIDAGKTLFAQEADNQQPIASLTKIMTYLLIRAEHELDEVVTIPADIDRVEGAQIDLYAYEKLTVGTLLEAILIPSANDAAVALAVWDAGSEPDFVAKMNAQAQDWGLDSAEFYNATGLDVYTPGEDCEFDLKGQCEKTKNQWYGNQMSARDLVALTRRALRDDFFRATVAKDHFYGQSTDEQFLHEKPSTNQLLGSFINSKGVKTGFTTLAGQCFINLSEIENGNEIITVVLGSSDRFTETKNLMDWIVGSYDWR